MNPKFQNIVEKRLDVVTTKPNMPRVIFSYLLSDHILGNRMRERKKIVCTLLSIWSQTEQKSIQIDINLIRKSLKWKSIEKCVVIG